MAGCRGESGKLIHGSGYSGLIKSVREVYCDFRFTIVLVADKKKN